MTTGHGNNKKIILHQETHLKFLLHFFIYAPLTFRLAPCSSKKEKSNSKHETGTVSNMSPSDLFRQNANQ